MSFIETRGNDGVMPKEVEFSEAILNPSASFGGLYVPKQLPVLEEDFIKNHIDKSYKELAFNILKAFKIDIDEEEINKALALYDNFDDASNPCPVVKVKDDLFVHEQYHGPTRAFKDMALQPFGSILSSIAKERNENYLILAATSGDTGPAALNTFRNKENIQVACLYPQGGTSDVQRLQMVCEEGKNLKVIGIKGNFDDAQSALKKLLASQSFKEELQRDGIKLSAANSVNFGRIIFQIIYHFWSYIQLLKQEEIKMGEKIYLVVPSGNFGNVLGGFYAKAMGVPVEKFLVASNENNILTQWINTGIYDIRGKELKLTKSPAMDILKSSNIERVMYSLYGAQRTKELLEDLNENNIFTMTKEETLKLQEEFSAVNSDDTYGQKVIKEFLDDGYLMDPHTATCLKAYENLKEKDLKTVIYSTAEWTKFSPTVLNSLNQNDTKYSDKEALDEISSKYNANLPQSIKDLFNSKINHDSVINKEDIESQIVKFIRES
ncbi:threonine synthase [Poseidonibacter ostreae]|jgi:threonine synthase|uniref:Threonine synthase n=1 Tax=Poseidonibacter ostreae TaxID=2654171 RepID=A0A6L4WWL4_9BACT|nr:threonine synthase [Poseidonibacter ostreae]KAB7887961.1 threonine synthase [Poseidonibacter ostreae]KAB7891120.1 threonine synthase [Poseidonibacter ostreae]KAB7892844.1 threonine synthase [Poseidonibacter ostreae]MAC84678.1 threonine synthase [Arcobacter sp.]|tara:strand:- start:697 stop:2178 length:1482 start_codon:yes stop_codon:yes gene_type:complete